LANIWALQLALESNGHHVVLAALDRFSREPVRLIVTDLEMPEMDGAELCRKVRCQPAFSQLPIVVLSAAPESPDDSPRWSTFFRKPADLSSLMRVVDSFVAERLTAAYITLVCADPASSRWQPVDARCCPNGRASVAFGDTNKSDGVAIQQRSKSGSRTHRDGIGGKPRIVAAEAAFLVASSVSSQSGWGSILLASTPPFKKVAFWKALQDGFGL
jgi:CheY-like chemotaxis protein